MKPDGSAIPNAPWHDQHRPDTAAVDTDCARLWIDRGTAEAAEIDDKGVVPDPKTATVVSAATDGERQHVLAGVCDAGQHVGHVSAAHDCQRVAINGAVVDGARRVIARIFWGDDHAADSGKIIYA
jgi:hypothetical protein